MGCAVNGPGEAGDADFGIAGGRDAGFIYAHGAVLRKVEQDVLVDELFREIDAGSPRACRGPSAARASAPSRCPSSRSPRECRMRPIRSLFVFAAGATAATPRGRAAPSATFGAAPQGARQAPDVARRTASGQRCERRSPGICSTF